MNNLENDHTNQLLKDWDDWQNNQILNPKPMTTESTPSLEEMKRFLDKQPFEVYEAPPKINFNPYGLNLVAEGNQIIIHVDEIKDTTKSGIKLTENARKELEEAEAKKDSRLYYIVGVSEAVAELGKYAPGMWVVLRPGCDAQSVRIDGKLFILTEAYNVSARVIFHEDKDVEAQYQCK